MSRMRIEEEKSEAKLDADDKSKMAFFDFFKPVETQAKAQPAQQPITSRRAQENLDGNFYIK